MQRMASADDSAPNEAIAEVEESLSLPLTSQDTSNAESNSTQKEQNANNETIENGEPSTKNKKKRNSTKKAKESEEDEDYEDGEGEEEEHSESEGSDFDPKDAEKEKKATKKAVKEKPEKKTRGRKKSTSTPEEGVKKRGRKKKSEEGEEEEEEEKEKKKTTRKRKKKADEEEEDSESEESEKKPKKRTTRKKKKKSDEEEEEEEPKEPAKMTMKDLIRNNPTGKPMTSAEENKKLRKRGGEMTSYIPLPVPTPPPQQQQSHVPMLKMDAEGNVILDTNSLVVETSSSSSALADDHDADARFASFSQASEATHRVNSASFTQRTPSEKWTPSETEKFYKALRTYGTDFTLLEKLFANRTRRQLKNKFKREEKEFPKRIDDALNNRLPLDLNHYQEAAQKATEKKRQIEEQKLKAAHGEDATLPASTNSTNNSTSPSSSSSSANPDSWETPVLSTGDNNNNKNNTNNKNTPNKKAEEEGVAVDADQWRDEVNNFDGFDTYDDDYDYE